MLSSKLQMCLKVTQAYMIALFDFDEDLPSLDSGPYHRLLELVRLEYLDLIATFKYMTVFPMYTLMSRWNKSDIVVPENVSPPDPSGLLVLHKEGKRYYLPPGVPQTVSPLGLRDWVNPQPPLPPHFTREGISKWVVTGYLKRFIKNRCQPPRRRYCDLPRLQLLQTLLQGVKRAAQVVPKAFVGKVYVDHMHTLRKEAPPLGLEQTSQIEWCGRYLLRGLSEKQREDPRYWGLGWTDAQPSKRASVEETFGWGGAAGHLQNVIHGISSYNFLRPDFEEPEHRGTDENESVFELFERVMSKDLLPQDQFRLKTPHYELLGMSYDNQSGKYEYRGLPRSIGPIQQEMLENLYSEVEAEEDDSDSVTSDNLLEEDEDIPGLFREYRKPDRGQVKVSGVLEPFKVRVITKTEASLSFYGKSFQALLWGVLFDQSAFRLIGEPLTEDHLIKVSKKSEEMFPGVPCVWVSGDYKGATDSLNINVTKALLRSLKQRLIQFAGYEQVCVPHQHFNLMGHSSHSHSAHFSTKEATVLINENPDFPIIHWSALERLLHEQRVDYSVRPLLDLITEVGTESFERYCFELPWYPRHLHHSFLPEWLERKMKDDEDVHIVQRNGQLMGSILSFPILCMANWTAYHLAMKEFNKDCSEVVESSNPAQFASMNFFSNPGFHQDPRRYPLLINGDDLLTKVPLAFYFYWKKETSRMGFELSIGKNYVNPTLLTVNSQLWKEVSPTRFLKINYVNLGSLLGRNLDLREKDFSLSEQFKLCIQGSCRPNEMASRFLYYHRSEIDRQTRKGFYNLFLPLSLGGLGLKAPPQFRTEFTTCQLKASCHLYDQLYSFESGFVHYKTVKKYFSRRPHYTDIEKGNDEWVDPKFKEKTFESRFRHLEIRVVSEDDRDHIPEDYVPWNEFIHHHKQKLFMREPSMARLHLGPDFRPDPKSQIVIPPPQLVRKDMREKRIRSSRSIGKNVELDIYVKVGPSFPRRKRETMVPQV